jgi:hypothetical protein
MQTLTLARVYELQGLKSEAFEIYKAVLKKDPGNQEARIGIRRLSGMRKKFLGVNEEMKTFFVQMNEKETFHAFERWLLEPWNSKM